MMADLAELTVAFADLLRQAGLPVTPDGSRRCVTAVGLGAPTTVDDLYWLARVTLVSRWEDIPVFDRVFDSVFRGLGELADRGRDPSAPTRPAARPRAPSARSAAGANARSGSVGASRDPEPGGDDRQQESADAASWEERLSQRDFGVLAPEELAELYALMRTLRLSPPLRPGRRARRHRSGDDVDLRATLRRSRRSGGEAIVTIHRHRPPRPRRIVVLCDISRSMEPYARAYLQFLHASAVARRAEVFLFATRLTRVTPALAARRPDAALARAGRAAPDWQSGTRIGGAVKAFLDDHGRRGMARGAVVVVVSDGWEHGDPAELGEQMRRLRRLAHRVVWVNPRTADARYRPLAGGMAAALPHCDALVSGHSAAALTAVVAAVRG